MADPKPIDLYTFDRLQQDDRESIVKGILELSLEEKDIHILLKYQKTVQPTQNAIRYRIGQYLLKFAAIHDRPEKHVAWVKKTLGLTLDQDRRLRRHARSINQRVAEGMDLLEALKLPALTLRDAKSRKDQAVEQNLDALRSLRGDLEDKIVKK